jgi:hypothetical protein
VAEKLIFAAMFDLIGLCQIVSGVILLKSVVKIRRFFREHNGDDSLDTAAMCRHASCFTLYLLSATAYYLMYSISTIDSAYLDAYFWTSIVYLFVTCISNLLLAYIYYDINKDQLQARAEVKAEEEALQALKESRDEVKVVEFDNEAELNANIWNNF